MVSFSCEACGDVLTKKKLDPHRNQCRGASYTCIDCMVHFHGTDYRSHTSCISEAQKTEGRLYKEKDNNKKANKGEKRKSLGPDSSKAMVPHAAYVEDAPDEGENTIAVIDVPPKAPTPPPIREALPEAVNVFDYLVADSAPQSNGHSKADESKMIMDHEASQYSQLSNGDGSQYRNKGFSYGNAPVESSFERYDSWSQFPESQQESQHSQRIPPYNTKIVTPGPDRERRHDDKSGQKRKRHQVDDLNMSAMKRNGGDEPMPDAPTSRMLHTGLTGGLTRLVTDSSFYDDRIDAGPTPVSPMKRSKREKELRDTQKRHSSDGKVTTITRYAVQEEDDRRRSRHHDRERDDHKRRTRHRSPSSSSDDARPSARRSSKLKAIDFKPHHSRTSSVQPNANNQLITYSSRAELFMSFVKGPDSERGCSINKALKRYHRERSTRGDEKDEDDKELWKSLRLRKNDRGEIVLFMA